MSRKTLGATVRLCRALTSDLSAGVSLREFASNSRPPGPPVVQLLRPVCDAAGAPAGWQLQPVVLPSWAASQHTAAAPAEAAEAAVADAAVSEDDPDDPSADDASAAGAADLPDVIRSATEGPAVLYRKGREDGIYRRDERQEFTIERLQNLYDELRRELRPPRKRPSSLTVVDSVAHNGDGSKPHWWSGMFSGGDRSSSAAPAQRPKGLYMFGGVGVGKTMLMDLLVQSSPPEFKLRRVHFHDFMLDVHGRLRRLAAQSDPLARVADDIADDVKVLALDEFFVTDVADAVILARLFGRLWDRGLVLVATSNRRPDALYENGLQRMLFVPFIDRLKVECNEHDMDSATDYRKLAHHHRGLYFTEPDRDAALHQIFIELTNHQHIAPAEVTVQMGRKLPVPEAGGCIAFFPFSDICGRPVAAADYIALVERYHSIAVSGVSVFSAATRPEAYRFMTLVDVMYDHTIRFFCAAAAEPFELFENIVTVDQGKALAKSGASKEKLDALVVDDNLGFTKDRTVSRLFEMQSIEYLLEHAEKHAPELLLALHDRKARGRKATSTPRLQRGGLRGVAGGA